MENSKVIWTIPAVDDLTAIVTYIQQDSHSYAAHLARKIHQGVKSLSHFPCRGRIIPELKNTNIREIIYSPYRIIYKIQQKRVAVLSILHSRQHLNKKQKSTWIIE